MKLLYDVVLMIENPKTLETFIAAPAKKPPSFM